MPLPRTSAPSDDNLKKLHEDLACWVPTALPAQTGLHPDLRKWRQLLLEVAGKPFAHFSFDQLKELQDYASVYKALLDKGTTGIDPRTVNEYQKYNFNERIHSCFNDHPDNEGFKAMRDFFLKNHAKVQEGSNFLFHRDEYQKIERLRSRLEKFLDTLMAFDPRLAPGAPPSGVQLSDYAPDMKKVFAELADRKSVLHSNMLDEAARTFGGYYDLEGDPVSQPRYGTAKSANDLYLDFNGMEQEWNAIYQRLMTLAPRAARTP